MSIKTSENHHCGRVRSGFLSTLSLVLFLLFSGSAALAAAHKSPVYAVAIGPAPVLNTPDFRSVFGGSDGRTMALDRCGQLRALEFIALPGTTFHIEAVVTGFRYPVYRVTSDDYPYPSTTGYFVDSRMVRTEDSPPPPRARSLPSPQTIIKHLTSAVGAPYQWGSNLRKGVPAMLSLYPPAPGHPITDSNRESWTLRGLDCSGLLYEATDGWTPRNTSTLVRYGSPVAITGLDADGIVQKVQPLDLIVWKGHVMIILDRKRLIESRLDCQGKNGGVRIRNLHEALKNLLAARIPLDEYGESAAEHRKKGFVIRRWHPGVSSDAP
ncbi:MAG: peptidoglycan endopeptidase [Geobacteraceae bacterium]